ncbi:helix-turn-helix domain-containing protein [Priestia aryabhattai]|uniref:helix-turn-helix domain-containing protein n=1 Tax=Priestia aryabhattai TaxID=412384 RepID=UPI001C8D0577|nr:helix-turn-helix domain-containing protein [Priestia aryabhattai]MBX9999592.1 helix-turn-helix domain-containing protein [Priestia aryabhattai]
MNSTNKHSKNFIIKRKNEMIERLGELYLLPSNIKYPTFEVQVITRYDAETGQQYKDTKTAVCKSLFTEEFFDGLHGGLFTLVMALVSHVDKDGFAFPSIATLSQQTGLSEKTIRRYLDDYANKEVKGRVLMYKMNFSKGRNHTVSLYYMPDCKVSFLDELAEQTEEEKSKEVAEVTKEVFSPPTLIKNDNEEELI